MRKELKYIAFIFSIGILNLFLLYFVKYNSNELSISLFSLKKTGNQINLVITILLGVGCILLAVKNKFISVSNLKFLSFLSVFYLIPLIIILMVNVTEIEFIESYFLGYPIKKIIPVILFVSNQTGLIYVLFLTWMMSFNNTLMVYLYSIISVISLILLLIIFSFINTYLIDEHQYLADDERFDYGIVLGAAVWSKNVPSPIFRGRIEKGADLYLNKIIKKIQLTGGNAPGELSEARTAYNYLISSYNVSEKNIIIEEITSTTNEQIKYVKKRVQSLYPNKKFIFVSDNFHLRRVEEMAEFYDLNAKVVSSEYKLNFEKSLYYRLRESIGLILFWFFAI